MSKGRIHWEPKVWDKVAKNFAAAFVNLSQSGKPPPFRVSFQAAQEFLPAKQRRNGFYASFQHCPQGFEGKVKAEIKKLTTVDHVNGNGAENAHPVVLRHDEGINFVIPQGVILNENFKKALTKAGFQFDRLDNILSTKNFEGQLSVETGVSISK